MKNMILLLSLSFLFSACEKFDDNYFSIDLPSILTTKKKAILEVKKHNIALLDSLLKHGVFEKDTSSLTCRYDNFFEKPIDNKEQRSVWREWRTSLDSLRFRNTDPDILFYLSLAKTLKPITQKELNKRLKYSSKSGVSNRKLSIYFSQDTIIECFGEFIPEMNLIVIYNYKDEAVYGGKGQYLGRGLILVHEVFHANSFISEDFSVPEQHILIDSYEKRLTDSTLNVTNYVNELYFDNNPYNVIKLFVYQNYLCIGRVAMNSALLQMNDVIAEAQHY